MFDGAESEKAGIEARRRLTPNLRTVQSLLSARARASINSGDQGKPSSDTRLRPGTHR